VRGKRQKSDGVASPIDSHAAPSRQPSPAKGRGSQTQAFTRATAAFDSSLGAGGTSASIDAIACLVSLSTSCFMSAASPFSFSLNPDFSATSRLMSVPSRPPPGAELSALPPPAMNIFSGTSGWLLSGIQQPEDAQATR